MAFRIIITDLKRKEINYKPVLEVFGLKDDGSEWKTVLWVNKYSSDFIHTMESAGKDGMVMVEMKKSDKVDKNGKNYWNVSGVEAIMDGDGEQAPPRQTPAPKSLPVEGPKPDVKVSPNQAVISPDNWRPEALERAVDLMHVAAAAQVLPKKMNGKLLSVSAVEIAKIFEQYLEGKEGVVSSTVTALASLNGLPGTDTPKQPSGMGSLPVVADDDVPF